VLASSSIGFRITKAPQAQPLRCPIRPNSLDSGGTIRGSGVCGDCYN
jgi:hypothetical protein